MLAYIGPGTCCHFVTPLWTHEVFCEAGLVSWLIACLLAPVLLLALIESAILGLALLTWACESCALHVAHRCGGWPRRATLVRATPLALPKVPRWEPALVFRRMTR